TRRPVQLTFNPSNDVFPLWSDDGRIFFMSVRDRPPQIYQMLPDNSGNETRVFKAPYPVFPSGMSPDSKMLFYTATDAKTAAGDIWAYSLETGRSTPVVNTPKDERYGVPSPDGRWLAYVTNDSDTYQVNVRALDGT